MTSLLPQSQPIANTFPVPESLRAPPRKVRQTLGLGPWSAAFGNLKRLLILSGPAPTPQLPTPSFPLPVLPPGLR